MLIADAKKGKNLPCGLINRQTISLELFIANNCTKTDRNSKGNFDGKNDVILYIYILCTVIRSRKFVENQMFPFQLIQSTQTTCNSTLFGILYCDKCVSVLCEQWAIWLRILDVYVRSRFSYQNNVRWHFKVQFTKKVPLILRHKHIRWCCCFGGSCRRIHQPMINRTFKTFWISIYIKCCCLFLLWPI